jgi:hypothetical protein
MITLSDIRIDNLTKIPIGLSGRWVNLVTRRDWRGGAVADPPPVGVVFIRQNNSLFWSKTETNWWKFTGGSLSRDALETRLTIWSVEELAKSFGVSEEEVAPGDPNGLTQYSYSINCFGITLSCTLKSSTYLPDIKESQVVFTGEPFRYTTIEAEPPSDLYCIFIAMQDINTLRKGLWRLRTKILARISEPWKSMLGYGRQGRILLAENYAS